MTSVTVEDLLAVDPGPLLARGLRGPDRPGGATLSDGLAGLGARAFAAQLRLDRAPPEALEACRMILDRARDDAPGVGALPPAVLGRLASGLAVQASSHAALARWMDALRQAIRTRLDLDAAVDLVERARRLVLASQEE